MQVIDRARRERLAAIRHRLKPKDAEKLARISAGLKAAMRGLDMSEIPPEERLQERGW